MMQESVLAQLDVSRETSEKLSHFVALVEKWNKAVNLIGRSTVDSIWTRHVLDSAQLRTHLASQPRLWLDLGSGSGFPGIVVAIMAAYESPESRFVLVESDQRKATFLRTACRELKLSASVLAARIESLPPQKADVISARALAALPDLCALLRRIWRRMGSASSRKAWDTSARLQRRASRGTWRWRLCRASPIPTLSS